MKRKLLVSLLSSLAIVVAAVSVAYAVGTFKANQEGFRQAGEGQAGQVTMQVEAGMADSNTDLMPDTGTGSPGGALSFSIENTSGVPIRVTKVDTTSACGLCGPSISSNKNSSGSFVADGSGDCAGSARFVAPATYNNWPTIAPHATLHVNGTDSNHLGAGMLHLIPGTPDGCQGATFALSLAVTATEATQIPGNPILP